MIIVIIIVIISIIENPSKNFFLSLLPEFACESFMFKVILSITQYDTTHRLFVFQRKETFFKKRNGLTYNLSLYPYPFL